MKCDCVKLIKFICGQSTFSIPVYQREYVWGEKECKKLLDDIIEVGKKSNNNDVTHFIGSVVYTEINEKDQFHEYSLIDGQQRLTTIILLYAALWSAAKKRGDNSNADRIFDTYLENKYAPNDYKRKLKPTDNNKEALDYVLKKYMDEPQNDIAQTQIYSNFKIFLDKIKDENIWKTIDVGIGRLEIAQMKLEKGDNDQRIFESLNATGVDLSQGDLIRNYILLGLDCDTQKDIYELYWQKIQTNTCDEREMNKEKKNRISEFFLRYLQYINRTKDIKENDVFNKFKEYLEANDIKGKDKVTKLFKEITLYSDGFNYFINPYKDNVPKNISKHLGYIKKLQFTVSYIFLMPVYVDYRKDRIDENIFVEVLELLQSYRWRRFIATGSRVGAFPSSQQLDIMIKLYTDAKLDTNIDKSEYVSNIAKVLLNHTDKRGVNAFPTDEQIRDVLTDKNIYAIRDELRHYLFERLGRKIDNEGNVNYDKLTTEHIFPKTPKPDWHNGQNEITAKELEEMNKLKNTLGNLTPLASEKNISLSNNSFHDKQKCYKTSIPLTNQLGNIPKWDKDAIEKRTAALTDVFINVWKRPTLTLTDIAEQNNSTSLTEHYNTINVKSIDTHVYKINTKQAEWQGQPISGNYFSELYVNIIQKAITDHPNVFTSDLKKRLKITDQAPDNCNYQKLNNNGFVATTSDTKTKIKRLKTLISALEQAGFSVSCKLCVSEKTRQDITNELHPLINE
ncbi:MAG: DUF262 domain-containing HNH endonuclease family protein [Planctomycetaceae bacterium]|jgi:uncharacterized protein with ParB-like and HNH nuclease domain|nr:DUF262 domain-containing HNH endonuclease family protein [Planctomycetaceae bacterium]